MQVELVSPERVLFSGEADMVICRTLDGEIAFLANHAPFIGALAIAPVKVTKPDGSAERFAVHGGFVEVKDNRVTLLSDVAELPDQIDAARARESLAQAGDDEAAVQRATVRLEVAAAPT